MKNNKKQRQDQKLMIELVKTEANKGSERCTTPWHAVEPLPIPMPTLLLLLCTSSRGICMSTSTCEYWELKFKPLWIFHSIRPKPMLQNQKSSQLELTKSISNYIITSFRWFNLNFFSIFWTIHFNLHTCIFFCVEIKTRV